MLRDPLFVPRITEAISIDAGYVGLIGALKTGLINHPNGEALMGLHTYADGEGTSKRKGSWDNVGTKANLSISHSQSNENKPLLTHRVMRRLDLLRFNNVLSRDVVLSSYVVTCIPAGNTFSEREALAVEQSLAMFVLLGGRHNDNSLDTFDASPGETSLRLFGGEA